MAENTLRMRWWRGGAALLLTLLLGVAMAREATPSAADPALEARVMALAEELRCLVCQNETIAASNAELAVDLRRQIRQQLTQGRSPEEIMGYMTARYGDFVRYKPPLRAGTALLWLGPFGLLLLGGVLLWRQLRQQHGASHPTGLSEADRQRAQKLLEGHTP